MTTQKILIACECSGAVRNAFRKRGFDVYSCDLLPAEDGSIFHLQGDVHELADQPWAAIIAFPPCTHLAVSGARYFSQKAKQQEEAIEFVWWLMNFPATYKALENPVGVISSKIRKPDQIIQPWQFGHPESKKTCLWLDGFPLLTPTNVLEKPACGYWNNQTPSGQNKLGPSPDRAKNRSRTYQGIADAMAEQWGNFLINCGL